MAEDTNITNPEQEPSFSIVTVPEELREQVLDYVRKLESEEGDTSAYMLRLSTSISTSTMTNWSGTGCSTWDTRGMKDMGCGDSD